MSRDKKYKDIQTLFENPHLNFYHMDALADSGKEFDYYFVSRNKREDLEILRGQHRAEGVVIYPLLREDPSRIVLLRQYRYPIGDWIYELPAGLIDEGESPEEAAVREMKEETGLDMVVCPDVDPIWQQPYYMGQGYTDEACVAVFGLVSGNIRDRKPEEWESIEVVCAGKEEVRRILGEEKCSLRMAYLMIQFLQSDEARPFRAFTKK